MCIVNSISDYDDEMCVDRDWACIDDDDSMYDGDDSVYDGDEDGLTKAEALQYEKECKIISYLKATFRELRRNKSYSIDEMWALFYEELKKI